MVRPLVLDASAAISIVLDEPRGVAVRTAILEHARRDGSFHVPGQFWLELANVLARRYGRRPNDIVAAVRFLDDLAITTVEVDRPLWLLTLQRADATGLAAYDAVYLALADVLGGTLLTLDAALADAAGSRTVRVGPLRWAETRAPYASQTPARVWAELGRYVAELRKEAAAG